MSATTTVIRPEFQLIVAGIDFTSATGIVVKAGTVYGRLYFPENCEVTGSFKGTILKDSWQVGTKYTANRKARYIEFICSDVSEYERLYRVCGRSNLASNCNRTYQLLKKCFNAPSAVRPAVPQDSVRVTREVETFNLFDPWFTINAEEVELFPGITSGNNFDDWADEIAAVSDNAQTTGKSVVAPAIYASDWETEDLHKSTVKQLKVIASKLGIKVYGTKAEIIAKIQAH